MTTLLAVPIVEWNGMVTAGKAPFPSVYVKSTPELERLIFKENVVANISGTNSSGYENRNFRVLVMPSKNSMGFRPNFQAATNYLTVLIETEWLGYPLTPGVIRILVDGDESKEVEESYIWDVSHPYELTIGIVVAILVLFLILLYIYSRQNDVPLIY